MIFPCRIYYFIYSQIVIVGGLNIYLKKTNEITECLLDVFCLVQDFDAHISVSDKMEQLVNDHNNCNYKIQIY